MNYIVTLRTYSFANYNDTFFSQTLHSPSSALLQYQTQHSYDNHGCP
jgi:hypothetical protein